MNEIGDVRVYGVTTSVGTVFLVTGFKIDEVPGVVGVEKAVQPGDQGSEKGTGEICPPRRIFNLGRQTVGDIFLRPLFARSDREVFRRVSLIVTVNYLFKFKPVKVISECSA